MLARDHSELFIFSLYPWKSQEDYDQSLILPVEWWMTDHTVFLPFSWIHWWWLNRNFIVTCLRNEKLPLIPCMHTHGRNCERRNPQNNSTFLLSWTAHSFLQMGGAAIHDLTTIRLAINAILGTGASMWELSLISMVVIIGQSSVTNWSWSEATMKIHSWMNWQVAVEQIVNDYIKLVKVWLCK